MPTLRNVLFATLTVALTGLTNAAPAPSRPHLFPRYVSDTNNTLNSTLVSGTTTTVGDGSGNSDSDGSYITSNAYSDPAGSDPDDSSASSSSSSSTDPSTSATSASSNPSTSATSASSDPSTSATSASSDPSTSATSASSDPSTSAASAITDPTETTTTETTAAATVTSTGIYTNSTTSNTTVAGSFYVTSTNTTNATATTTTTVAPSQYTITSNTTLNSTSTHNPQASVAANAPSSPLTISLYNNLDTSSSVNAYLAGLDGDGAAFFLLADGTAYYPPNPADGSTPTEITEDIAIPLGAYESTVTVSLPNYISSGRVYFSVGTITFYVNYGSDGPEIVYPSFTNSADVNIDVNYGFAEFTWTDDDDLYSNLSYVDFVGLIISQLVESASESCQVSGLPGNAVDTICAELEAQEAADGQPWLESCQTDSSGDYLRVLAPLHLMEINTSALADYYTDYVDDVWDYYTTASLTISDDTSDGTYVGQVNSSGYFVFNDTNAYAKPDITDIMGCNSGPFANPGSDDAGGVIVPRFCAAFVRSTLLLSGGDLQPDGVAEADYYSVSPTDHYSRIVHATETDGKGYAFSYDDVVPAGGDNPSGECVVADPTGITFYVGGLEST